MKIFFLIVLGIIYSNVNYGQSPDTKNDAVFNQLLNYVPSHFDSIPTHPPENKLLKSVMGMNTLGAFLIYCSIKDDLKLSESDNKWLQGRIKLFASALYRDGKQILLKPTGGYAGCSEQRIDTLRLNNIEILNLYLCQTCIDYHRNDFFVNTFNLEMYSLMEISPPDYKTTSFEGEFIGIGNKNIGVKLILNKNGEFKFWINRGHGSDFTQGLWMNKNDTLILNSKGLTENEKLTFLLSSAEWIEFSDLKFQLRKDKLVGIENKKIKLKSHSK
ncbi:hypothetical protein [Fulvivirga ligni]|uniref:hypothetical protein n=1 Tax=Fulvivirga ligni TaxID=2904246 RepID=UPI001F30DBEB|nr:hypothetical protein [Fulvivirga ligni]UII19597.1 hypothetical protein LVD16_17295 [Fulvivirga ligni]